GLDGAAKTQMIAQIKNLVPLKRLAQPIELAKAAVYLASNESRFMLGVELLLDGGVLNLSNV
ncbi:MAG: SDR family oxidoreductase, partial [Moraxellaceae bacterium]